MEIKIINQQDFEDYHKESDIPAAKQLEDVTAQINLSVENNGMVQLRVLTSFSDGKYSAFDLIRADIFNNSVTFLFVNKH
tara:strand:- start:395 stop:634 length:240 start_codon:yes stop_codon:yes gene_type:complete